MNDVTKEAPLQNLTGELLDQWATDLKGPVALHLKQRLLPVEAVAGDDLIIYPPTFADVGYNIDRLSDGTCVALIDSVGSQANRIEPAFKSSSGFGLECLVPQLEIILRTEPCGECESCKKSKRPKAEDCKEPWKEKRSLFDLAHRAADAVVQSSPSLLPDIAGAFETLRRTGNAGPLCTIAPTSLVFGCWDSRGGSGEKLPRLVRSIIRAWDVDQLHVAAQFNSVWKALSDEQKEELTKETKKKGAAKLSDKGLNDAPAVFRKDGTRVLGGILVHDRIQRDITVNLVALRGIRGKDHAETEAIRKHLLSLALLAATVDIDLFLREGCNLRYADGEDSWAVVPRRGDVEPIDLSSSDSQETLKSYAISQAEYFIKSRKDLDLEHKFDLAEAKKLLFNKSDDESEGGNP